MSLPSTPSRFSTRREKSITPSKPKPIDVGNPLGIYDTNLVRDRVRQWQAQGGGVVHADDIGGGEDEQPEILVAKSWTPKKEPRTPSSDDKGIREETTLNRSGRRKDKLDEEAGDRSRSGSAPAKRIVSDAHWRKKRNPPQSTTSSRATKDAMKDTTPTWALPDDGIRVKPIRCSQPDERPILEAKRVPKRESVGGDDGIRVYVTPPGSQRSSGRPRRRGQSERSLSEMCCESELEVPNGSPPPIEISRQRECPSPGKSLRTSPLSAKENSAKRKSSAQKPLDPDDSPISANGAPSDGRGSIKSHKGGIFSQVFGDSRRRLAKQAPEVLPAPRVPSIEAWLNETPDPFIDTEEAPVKVVEPLRPSADKRKPIPQQFPVADANKIWDALDTKEGTRRAVTGSRRKRRIPSSAIYEDNPFPADFDSDSAISGSGRGTASAPKFVDLVQDSPPKMSPSSLKRRSARKSVSSSGRERRKSTVSRDQTQDDDTASALSSNITTSSVEGPDPKYPMKPPGLNIKRPFPSTGPHRLSTIASVETFNTRHGAAPPSVSEISERTTQHPTIDENEAANEARDQFDPNPPKRNNSRLTKHADLISVLSLPRAGNRSIQSARSIRTNRSRLATATVTDLMQELVSDESKYMRELRTLVDGVIPVLLTCVLSKSDSAVAAGLFRSSGHGHDDPNFTRPIVDMGIALERLKKLHLRIPQDDPNALLTWAHGAQRVYTEFLKAWRMGFQDVVVNLAPAAEGDQGLDEGLPRNENGDVVNGDGERVDVAFLLKRPLVRLKYLQKTLKGINFLKPSAEAELLAIKYQKLVEDARQRSNEERARLEDEAASNIDPTRARDPRTLAPLTGVIVDRTRRVRARDHFNLALQHSSGQRVDCRVELLLRDEAADSREGGDLLICEVDGTGRWLLFPPVQYCRVSARNGDLKGEIVVMIRGIGGTGSEWQELISLRSEDEQAGFEWVQMLGLTPVPPRILRSQSFVSKHQRTKSASASGMSSLDSAMAPTTPGKSRTPSPREVEVPIGEQGNNASKAWEEPVSSKCTAPPSSSPSRQSEKIQKQPSEPSPTTPSKSSNYVDQVNDLRSLPSQSRVREPTPVEPTRTPRSFKEALGLSGTSSTVGLKRARAKRLSRHGDVSPSSPRSQDSSRQEDTTHPSSPDTSATRDRNKDWPSSPHDVQCLSPESNPDCQGSSLRADAVQQGAARPPNHRSRSSVPSMELPYIPKSRQNSPPPTPIAAPEVEHDWPAPTADQLPNPPSKLTKRRPIPATPSGQQGSLSPATPAHRSSSPVQLDGKKTPVLTSGKAKPRRSSSPLKHEYEPSTASESSSDSEASTVERHDATSVSDSSEDEELENGDAPTPLMPLGTLKRFSNPRISPKTSVQQTPASTIKPSESASQAPYKTVPAQPTKATKTIATIFSWSDMGSWQGLHPDECSIVITPGLIEAYEMSAAHSNMVPHSSSTPVTDPDAFSDMASTLTSQNDEVQGDRPLIALELTPLVPLRRGTALDISIRSPPAPQSQITSGNNIMFRSRNPEECEALYALINYSRINNPTFIALQNARASGSSFGADRRTSIGASSSRRSWFGGFGRSSSYRASSAPTPSIAPSESSIGSMSSAFSALKRFGKGSGSGMFNISRSTIGSREGSRANSIYTSSDNSSGSGTSSPVPPGIISAGKDAPIGLSNAKIRLYTRETASRWRDMGSAKLTIMRPEKSNIGLDGRPNSSGGHQGGNDKRIVVHGKTKGEVLLDVQLGESCFERVARTGIALSVWEDVVGPNGEVGVVNAQGGVVGGRAQVYMIQMKSEAETAYTFSVVGKLRY